MPVTDVPRSIQLPNHLRSPILSLVSEAQRQQFQEEGYFVLESALDDETLKLLREECQVALDRKHAEMDASGDSSQGITHRGQRYFISHCYREQPRLRPFLSSRLMADLCQATLGDDAYLFWEQYVVKGRQGMKFSWHQDSGYVKFRDPATQHRPYLTCWCALDDVDESNGTAYVLPHSRGETRETIYEHTHEEGTNDLLGYTGSDPGEPVIAPAGSIATFTSYNLHRSGTNNTNHMRRVYLAQYSGEELRGSDGGLWAMAVPFLADGKIIYSADQDTPTLHQSLL